MALQKIGKEKTQRLANKFGISGVVSAWGRGCRRDLRLYTDSEVFLFRRDSDNRWVPWRQKRVAR